MQQAVQPVDKLLIQGAVNPLGVGAIAAFNAAERVDDFALLPERSLGVAMTTFVAQNRGAGEKQRVKDGFQKGMLLEAAYGAMICLVMLVCSEPLMRLFASGSDADLLVQYGGSYLRTMAVFYILPALSNGVQGFFQPTVFLPHTAHARHIGVKGSALLHGRRKGQAVDKLFAHARDKCALLRPFLRQQEKPVAHVYARVKHQGEPTAYFRCIAV